jgi:ubiquinone biosynthesis protein
MLAFFKHMARLFKVLTVLARYDALFFLDMLKERKPIFGYLKIVIRFLFPRYKGVRQKSPGLRLALALETLGPAFIKLGQTLATRVDIIGEDIAQDLRRLQDSLPAFPFDFAKARIEAELGKPLEELYLTFDPTPVAAASIAQVHFATTLEGVEVAVKVLRPNIRADLAKDLETFTFMAALIEKALPRARRLKPLEVIKTLRDTIEMEVDLEIEAKAATRLKKNMANEPNYRVPTIDWELTSKSVLTIERIVGIPIGDKAALKAAGHDLNRLSEVVIRTFLTQAIRDGFFHGDLHQGNFFVEPDGTLVPVDFGIMGRLDNDTRRFLAEILWGFQQKNYGKVADVHFEAGYVPNDQNRAAFTEALKAIADPIINKNIGDVSIGDLLAKLLKTTGTFSMQTQPQLLVLQRTMVMAEGLAHFLNNDANMWALSRPTLERHIIPYLGLGELLGLLNFKGEDGQPFWEGFFEKISAFFKWLMAYLPKVFDYLKQLFEALLDWVSKGIPKPA